MFMNRETTVLSDIQPFQLVSDFIELSEELNIKMCKTLQVWNKRFFNDEAIIADLLQDLDSPKPRILGIEAFGKTTLKALQVILENVPRDTPKKVEEIRSKSTLELLFSKLQETLQLPEDVSHELLEKAHNQDNGVVEEIIKLSAQHVNKDPLSPINDVTDPEIRNQIIQLTEFYEQLPDQFNVVSYETRTIARMNNVAILSQIGLISIHPEHEIPIAQKTQLEPLQSIKKYFLLPQKIVSFEELELPQTFNEKLESLSTANKHLIQRLFNLYILVPDIFHPEDLRRHTLHTAYKRKVYRSNVACRMDMLRLREAGIVIPLTKLTSLKLFHDKITIFEKLVLYAKSESRIQYTTSTRFSNAKKLEEYDQTEFLAALQNTEALNTWNNMNLDNNTPAAKKLALNLFQLYTNAPNVFNVVDASTIINTKNGVTYNYCQKLTTIKCLIEVSTPRSVKSGKRINSIAYRKIPVSFTELAERIVAYVTLPKFKRNPEPKVNPFKTELDKELEQKFVALLQPETCTIWNCCTPRMTAIVQPLALKLFDLYMELPKLFTSTEIAEKLSKTLQKDKVPYAKEVKRLIEAGLIHKISKYKQNLIYQKLIFDETEIAKTIMLYVAKE